MVGNKLLSVLILVIKAICPLALLLNGYQFLRPLSSSFCVRAFLAQCLIHVRIRPLCLPLICATNVCPRPMNGLIVTAHLDAANVSSQGTFLENAILHLDYCAKPTTL